jgi:hypothetical protein
MNPEDLLTDALHHRVERTDYPSTPLSTVAGRAGAIRVRRRRTTVLAAAAAVGVVVVPGAVWLRHTPGSSPQPGQTISSGPTSNPTEQTSVPPSVSLDALRLGHKPGIDYLVGDTYVTMNGDRITSPAFGTAGTATPVGGGILTAEARPVGQQGSFRLSHVALVVNGTAQPLGCGTSRFAMSTDGVQSAYWLADSCTLGGGGKLYFGANNTMGESGPGYAATPTGAIDEPVGIVQQGVVVNDVGNGPTPLLVGWDGTTSRLRALVSAGGSDENNDVVSGQLAADSGTGAIVDAASGAVKVRVPGWRLGQFSDDGKYVLGYQPGDGIGTDNYAVFDAETGSQVVELPHLGMMVALGELSWDFDGTVLAVANGTGGSAIVRFDLQGNLTRATPVADTPNGYRLATRP